MKKRITEKQIFFWFLLILFMLILLPAWSSAISTDQAPGRKMAKQATQQKKIWNTTDHSKHEILQQDFTSGPEVTEACLSCHTEAALQFHKTIHWTWMANNTPHDNKLGKGGLSINNF